MMAVKAGVNAPLQRVELGGFLWSISELLRGPYHPNQYGNVLLPLTILRRLDAILEPTRDRVLQVVASNGDGGNSIDREVVEATGLSFYNVSKYQFSTPSRATQMRGLLEDVDNLRENLIAYLDGFRGIDVFECFDLPREVERLDKSDRLRLIVERFREIDLHPESVSNATMGGAYEYLIGKFAESSNEVVGEHYTPRDATRLIVDLLFFGRVASSGIADNVCGIYDPTAGTGGMLSVAEEHLLAQNPDANVHLYGQEYNEQSYAICKSDLLAKGQDTNNIRLGNTLTEDKFAERTFDFCLSNPPYGVDWKAEEREVKAERSALGDKGRFAAGLPSVSDGQMLFLMHLAHKMRPAAEGGGRAGIVLNGSPLFNGAAESGPSEIRRWLLESDLVDAIVALPTNMFFNTGIATYIWILDNTKTPERQGKVQLIDATSFWSKLRKNLGSKNREVTPGDRERILKLYEGFSDDEHSKILDNKDFGYWTVTVERPLLDEEGQTVTDAKGRPKPNPKLRDTENVPFTYEGGIDAYFKSEVLPHVPDAWIDEKKTKVGFEIPFTRLFYKYVPPRPLTEIDADLEAQVARILSLLREVES